METNEWYRLDDTRFSITIKKDETTYKTIENDEKYGYITINKTDEDHSDIKLEGAVFEIYNSKGTKVDTLTTNSNGYAKSKALPILDTYTVKEVKAVANYSVNTKETTVKFTTSTDNQVKTIDYTNKHDEGELEVLKVNKLNETMKIQGVKFELYSEEFGKVIASGKTDSNGKLKFSNIRTGSYKLYEVEANEWYRLDTTKHSITIKKDETTYKTIKNQPKMGHIAIIKYDRDYKDMKLAKAKFAVLDSKGVTVDTIITDSNGYGKSKELPLYETYTVKEIEAPTHYLINANETTVKYKSNEDNVTKEYEYYDIRKEGNLKVYKVDDKNQRIALGNVEFDLYSKEFNKVIGTFHTDVNGEILVKNLREADYIWIEKTTNRWYDLAENTEVTVEWNKTVETTILNKLKQGKVQVVKVDKDNNEIKLKGVKFQVIDDKGNVLETIITDDKGEATTNEYPVRDFENLTLKEIETLKEYKLNDKPIKVTLKANEIITKQVENEVKKAQIKVIKVDKDNNEIKLEGVVFEVLDQNGKVVQTLETDENGEAITERIPISQTYTVREKETLREYKLNTEEITSIKLNEDEIRTLKFTNELKKAKIQVIKVDKEDHEIKLKNVVFEVYNSKGKLVDTITTNEKGIATTKELPVNDTYSLKEIKTDKWYKLNTDITKIDLTKYIDNYKDNIVENITIENQIKKGKVKVIKVDKDNNEIKLEGVIFELLDENGKVIETLKTDKNGEAISKEWRINQKYSLREKETQEIYELNDEIKVVELQEDQITTITFENELKKAQIEVIKVDKEDHEIKLKDVVFEVYNSNGELVDTIITDKNGKAITKRLAVNDTYSLKEIKTDKWYKLNTDITKIDLTKYIIEYKDNIVDSTTIENQIKKGKVKVIKVDKDNNEIKLEGVIFELLDENGKVIETLKTDKNGEAISKEWRINQKYSLREKETQEIYVLNEEIKTVELKEEQITNITFENKLKKAKIQVIKVDKEDHEIKLKDVEFEVYNSKGELVDTIKTDEKGIATTKEIPVNDTYSLKETKTDEYYKLNEEITEIDLTKYIADYKENIVDSTTIENQVKKGTIKVIKTDGETTYSLKDVEFEVYNSKGELVDTIITDENGEAITKELRIDDQYTVIEKITNKGYILNDKTEVIELKEDEISNLTFENFKEKGKIKIIKSSSDGKVEGFTFKITGTSVTGEQIEMTITTDKDGIILIDDVLVGEYTIEEIRDAAYEETEPQTIKVVNGETAEVSFYNKLIEVDTPQTGDESNIKFVAGILLLSLLGLACICSKIYREKKNKEKDKRK